MLIENFRHRFWCDGFAYYIGGPNQLELRYFMEECKILANFVGCDYLSVQVCGRIDDSNWCRNYYLYAAKLELRPDNLREVKNSHRYILNGSVD